MTILLVKVLLPLRNYGVDAWRQMSRWVFDEHFIDGYRVNVEQLSETFGHV